MAVIKIEIEKCWDGCPFCKPLFGGHGDADDWRCEKAGKMIASYVEYPSEMPNVPKWCPISNMRYKNGRE